jgi:hypothetical protein
METYDSRIFILESIGIHVPYDLVSEELGEFGRLNDVSLNIAQDIIAQGLHNLRDVKEGHVHRMTV